MSSWGFVKKKIEKKKQTNNTSYRYVTFELHLCFFPCSIRARVLACKCSPESFCHYYCSLKMSMSHFVPTTKKERTKYSNSVPCWHTFWHVLPCTIVYVSEYCISKKEKDQKWPSSLIQTHLLQWYIHTRIPYKTKMIYIQIKFTGFFLLGVKSYLRECWECNVARSARVDE